jgi:hypothetical protein
MQNKLNKLLPMEPLEHLTDNLFNMGLMGNQLKQQDDQRRKISQRMRKT